MIVVVMGVAGSGKTTIGSLLARELGCAFLDADSLHPESNIQAMEDGRALADGDRATWLEAVHARLLETYKRGGSIVVACSALKRVYRQALGRGISITWVHLKGDPDLIRSRLDQRIDHFMRATLLASQLADLEEPSGAIAVDVSSQPATVVSSVLAALRLTYDVRVLETLELLSVRAAESAAAIIDEVVGRTGRCSVVLSGGSTPVLFHKTLATRFGQSLPWAQVHVFWADERYVPHDSPLSNYRMANDTLLRHVPCPAGNIHPMPTHFADPAAAAQDYESTLERYWAGDEPKLDLVLLGMGPEGHTASLFPGEPALQERKRDVVAATVPAEPPRRLTLTPGALARSAHVHFLVAGSDKADAIGQVLSGTADPNVYPAAGVRAVQRPVVWWLDRAAAARYVSNRAAD